MSVLDYKPKKPKLSAADLQFLREKTDFTDQDIREWFTEFIRECPSGKLSRKKATEIYRSLGMTRTIIDQMVDQIFTIFDKSGHGRMEFRDFLLATHMTSTGSPEEKLRWQFKLMDRDGSGEVEAKEMIETLVMIYENTDVETGMTRVECAEKAKELFQSLDTDNDHVLTEDEFVYGCLNDKCLVERILRTSDPISDEEEAEEDEDDDWI